MSSDPDTIPLPRRALAGLEAYIDLGAGRIDLFAARMKDRPLELDFGRLVIEISKELSCTTETLFQIVRVFLIPLNQIRRALNLSAPDFIAALTDSIEGQAPNEWKDRNLGNWKNVASHSEPFFEPDNFFSQASKAFELLTTRPAIMLNSTALTDLRPIYDEAETRILAMLHTNTLVLKYVASGQENTLHLSLDNDDLETLIAELNRAKASIEVNQQHARNAHFHLVTYGTLEDAQSTEDT